MSRVPIFLDRDGVINEFPGCGKYVTSYKEFRFIDGVVEALARLYNAGYDIYIISNQSGVGKGLYSYEDLQAITEKMKEALSIAGVKIAGIFYCVHRPEEGCLCRKPNTYNIEKVLEDYPDVARGEIYIIGDDEKDIIMGKKAGIVTVLVRGGSADLCKGLDISERPDIIVDSLPEFVAQLGL